MLTEKQVKRFWSLVRMAEDCCWLWQGKRDPTGYGRFGKGWKYAHRIMVELHGRTIPSDREIDHICHNRACVNPDHLRIVTHQENLQNGIEALKTHCKNGHPLSGSNLRKDLRGRRHCRACGVKLVARWRQRHPAKARKVDRDQKRKRRAALKNAVKMA